MSVRGLAKKTLITAAILLTLWPAGGFAFDIQPPNPVIKIPGVSDFEVPQPKTENCPEVQTMGATGCLFIPWIGQYIAGLYRFGVFAATILAVVVLMVAGYIWITAAGNVEQVSRARGYIGGAITGLVLMLGSYTILNIINPKLVQFDALRIPVIKKVPIDEYQAQLAASGGVVPVCQDATGKEINTLVNDGTMPQSLVDSLNNWGQNSAVNLSPVFLAAIAKTENAAYDPTIENSIGAFGLMQMTPGAYETVWKQLGGTTSPGCPLDDFQTCSIVTVQGQNGQPQQKQVCKLTDICKRSLASEPDLQVGLASLYLKYVQNKLDSCGYGWDPTLIAAGYNAGPNRDALCQGNPPPFDETLQYVQKVSGHLKSLCSKSGGQANPPKGPNPVPGTPGFPLGLEPARMSSVS